MDYSGCFEHHRDPACRGTREVLPQVGIDGIHSDGRVSIETYRGWVQVSRRVCGERGAGPARIAVEANMSVTTTFAAVAARCDDASAAGGGVYLARYSGHTQALYAYQLRRWFGWCESNSLDALVGIQRAHVELYIRYLRDCGLRDSIPADPAVYVRLVRPP